MATTAIPKTKISGGSFLLEERQTADVFTPEDFSEQHRMIGQTAEEFSVNEILPQAEKIEHKDYSVSRDLQVFRRKDRQDRLFQPACKRAKDFRRGERGSAGSVRRSLAHRRE